jgi:hypothetical protein
MGHFREEMVFFFHFQNSYVLVSSMLLGTL